jgi:ribonuclease HI
MGAYDDICLARRSGFTNIELRPDSMAAVKAIEGANLDNSGGRSLVRRICSLIHESWNVRIQHVYKEANRVADALASLECQLVDVS